jgi:hypothetical protein
MHILRDEEHLLREILDPRNGCLNLRHNSHPRELKTANCDHTRRDEESRLDQRRDDGIHSLEMHDG